MGALRHVAIIMDGNGRWAQQRHLGRLQGHRHGVAAVEKTIRCCREHNVQVLTLFAFSTENWQRPDTEVNGLFNLFIDNLRDRLSMLQEHRIRFHIIGDCSRLPPQLQAEITHAQSATAANDELHLVVAVNYGGHWDIRQAVAQATTHGNPMDFERYLALNRALPAALAMPDLFIRTGGEQRISNFLLWHLAYSELYFIEAGWPDFNEQRFADAVAYFHRRQRRYGTINAD